MFIVPCSLALSSCFFLLLGVTTLEAAAEEVIATVVARHLRTTDVAAVATLDRDRAPDHTVRVHQTPLHTFASSIYSVSHPLHVYARYTVMG